MKVAKYIEFTFENCEYFSIKDEEYMNFAKDMILGLEEN